MKLSATKPYRIIAWVVGLVQALVALSILFLPVFATCYLNEAECRRQSYIQMGGNIVGYLALLLMIVAGGAVFLRSRRPDVGLLYRTLWIGAISSFFVAAIAGWGFGIVFLPGALLMTFAALSIRANP